MLNNDYTYFSIIQNSNRLDIFLVQLLPQYSRALLQRFISSGGVLVDGQVCVRMAQRIRPRTLLAIDYQRLSEAAAVVEECAPEALALDIVYEDEALLVINKPAGMVTHPGHGNYHGTLQSGLLHHHQAAAGLVRGGIVHRLDKDTSGLLVVAKTAAVQKQLIAQFKTREIGREYLALVHGTPPATGVINHPLARHRHDRLRMAVTSGGKEAITAFTRRQQWKGFALLCCRLATGRTHQIRVHLEYSGYPIVGDKTYHRRAVPLPFAIARQMLHAAKLHLTHPQSGAVCEWQCALPDDIQEVMAALDAAAGTPPP